jgi:hypothetical protein
VVLAASLDLLRGDGEQYRLRLGAESLCRRPDRRWSGHWRDPDRHRDPVSCRGSSSEPPPMAFQLRAIGQLSGELGDMARCGTRSVRKGGGGELLPLGTGRHATRLSVVKAIVLILNRAGS